MLLPAPACAIASPAAAVSQDAGTVDSVEGEAFARSNRVRRDLAPAAPVFIGDLVATGTAARVAMRLGRDTLLRLGAEAQVTIDRFLTARGGEISLGAGAILFDRPDGSRPAPFRVRSPFGLIAVRGTRFFAGPSNNVFGVFVAHGRVAVSAGGQRVELGPGEGTNIATPGAPPSPPARWQPQRVQAALASVT